MQLHLEMVIQKILISKVMMIIAYFLAKTFASGIEQIKCISLECGLQNGTLAVFVATEISNEIVYMIPTSCAFLPASLNSITCCIFSSTFPTSFRQDPAKAEVEKSAKVSAD